LLLHGEPQLFGPPGRPLFNLPAGNAGWPFQFRFAVHTGWSRVPELLSLGVMRMRGFLRRFFLGDFGPPPPPDLSQQPSIAGQSVDEILYSESKSERAIITHDTSGIHRIHVQFWDSSDWKAGQGAFWYDGGGGTLTDTIEQARKLARERLHLTKHEEVA